MTLVQLKHFVALAELGSFAKASKQLFVTQPALSRSVAALEDELGHRLFDRIGRRIAITPFGQNSLQLAKNLLHDAQFLRKSGQAQQSGLSGHIRLGLGSGPGAVLSVPLMLHMAQNHPQLHLTLARGQTDLLIDALRARRIDAAVVDVRSLRPAPDLEVSQPVEMGASFMCRAQHPLLALGRAVRISEILRYPVASTPLSDEVARLLIERYGQAANPEDMVTLRSDDTGSLASVALQSDAVVLTINAAGQNLSHLTLDPPFIGTARFGLVTLTGRAPAPGLALIQAFVAKTLLD